MAGKLFHGLHFFLSNLQIGYFLVWYFRMQSCAIKELLAHELLCVSFVLIWRSFKKFEPGMVPIGSTGRLGYRSGRDFLTGQSSWLKRRSNSPFLQLKDV